MTVVGNFTLDVNASAQRAFSVISDLEGLHRWDGPVAKVVPAGDTALPFEQRQYRAYMRPAALRIALHVAVVSYQPPLLLKLSVTGRFLTSSDTWQVTPTPQGATLSLHTEHTLLGVFRLLAPLMFLGKPVQRRALRRLKRLIENPVTSGEGTAVTTATPMTQHRTRGA